MKTIKVLNHTLKIIYSHFRIMKIIRKFIAFIHIILPQIHHSAPNKVNIAVPKTFTALGENFDH
ncbi:MAG: hypothetical protein ACTSRZ_18560 [Promethearchaeota archaeon]